MSNNIDILLNKPKQFIYIKQLSNKLSYRVTQITKKNI